MTNTRNYIESHSGDLAFFHKLSISNQTDEESMRALSILWRVLPDMVLNNIQEVVFTESWKDKTYHQISEICNYDAGYLKDVGHHLWRSLSAALGETCTKRNFRALLMRRAHIQAMEACLHPDSKTA